MLHKGSFIFVYLCLSLSLLVATMLMADRGEGLKLHEIDRGASAQARTTTPTNLQRFAANSAASSENLTAEDLTAAASKWEVARPILNAFWGGAFAQRGLRYATPRVHYLVEEETETGCGTVGYEGPFYCPNDHTIYCDPFFVAGEMKRVGDRLGTDGDMAAIMIEAHEWGHAVQRMLGLGGGTKKFNELQADCLAGGFANYSHTLGLLEKGDLEEAQMAIADGGDAKDDHGTPQERMESFMLGYQRGGGACWGR
jgi:predicted metalloprotease